MQITCIYAIFVVPFAQNLKKNEQKITYRTCGWTPDADSEIKLYHSLNDDIVAPENSQMMYQWLVSKGGTERRAGYKFADRDAPGLRSILPPQRHHVRFEQLVSNQIKSSNFGLRLLRIPPKFRSH